jgi:hypothetical protein
MTRILQGLGAFALFAASACSSTSSDKTRSAPDGGGGGGSGNKGTGGSSNAHSDAGSKVFKLAWATKDGSVSPPDSGVPDAGFTAPRLAGVKVCVYQHPEIACVTSAADGTFTLEGLAPLTNLILTFDKTGYAKASKSIQTASTDMQITTPIDMFAEGSIDKTVDGGALDSTKGSVFFFTIGPVPGSADQNAFQGLAGATVTIAPVKGSGPFYIGKNGKTIDKALTQTLSGTGYFYNLDPGDYTLTFDDSAVDCEPISLGASAWGIPVPATPHSVKFTVLANYTADEIGVFCTQKSVIVGGDGG